LSHVVMHCFTDASHAVASSTGLSSLPCLSILALPACRGLTSCTYIHRWMRRTCCNCVPC
jgi:hypothetical protein